MARKPLHPALVQRAVAVKQAHAHLTKTVPGFTAMKPHDRTRAVHAHIGRSAASYLAGKKSGAC